MSKIIIIIISCIFLISCGGGSSTPSTNNPNNIPAESTPIESSPIESAPTEGTPPTDSSPIESVSAILSLTIDATSIDIGATTTATVTLKSLTQMSNVVVNFVSGNPAIATVSPNSCTIINSKTAPDCSVTITGVSFGTTNIVASANNAKGSNESITVVPLTFTWVAGSNLVDEAGVYGKIRVPSVANIPGARSGSIDWVDQAGNIWLFGGGGFDSQGGNGYLNDLWKYNPATNEWTWVFGSDRINATGVYGTKGKPSIANIPGARSDFIGWIDQTGNLWLFGGYGYDSQGISSILNDLWKYSPQSNEWMWVAGSDRSEASGVYGTKGKPSIANIPGARAGSIGWVDPAGNFWLFGGGGFDSQGGNGYLNDLWTYSPQSNEWTWVSGSNVGGTRGVYGTKGTPSVGNIPGGRQNSIGWIDQTGNLWLFGGDGYATVDVDSLNDLWQYSPGANEWRWVAGSNSVDESGVYGIKGIPSAKNIPGARNSSISWVDSAGNFWLFGGYGYDSLGNDDGLNDLWQYSPGANEWTWVSGSNLIDESGVYGTIGVPSIANIPGARGSSIGWVDQAGNFWLFGGYGYDSQGNNGDLNDLWKISNLYE